VHEANLLLAEFTFNFVAGKVTVEVLAMLSDEPAAVDGADAKVAFLVGKVVEYGVTLLLLLRDDHGVGLLHGLGSNNTDTLTPVLVLKIVEEQGAPSAILAGLPESS
jgi:hypothetical protein